MSTIRVFVSAPGRELEHARCPRNCELRLWNLRSKTASHSFRSAILMNPGWLKFARRREKRRTTFSVPRSVFGAGGAVGTRSRAIRRRTSMKLRSQELDRLGVVLFDNVSWTCDA